MLRILALLGLLMGTSGHAQTLYKCSEGGKLTYASAPCDSGAVSAIAVPAAPEPDPAADLRFKRDKAMLAQLQKERAAAAASEARQRRAAAQIARAAAVGQRRCARLALQKRWADDDADRAAGFDKEALQRKAQRMGEARAVECRD